MWSISSWQDRAQHQPAFSTSKAPAPWGWVIGTGLYIDDVNVEIGQIAKQLNAIASVILLINAFRAFYIIRHTVLADRVRRIIWEERERLLTALKREQCPLPLTGRNHQRLDLGDRSPGSVHVLQSQG